MVLPNDNVDTSKLAMFTFREIPVPNDNAQQIVALLKQKGKVNGYKLANGEELDKAQAVNRARNGGIIGVGIASRNGNEYLKSLPDSSENNNLGNLPSIKH